MNGRKADLSKAAKFIAKYKYIIAVIAAGLLLMSFPTGEKETGQTAPHGASFDINSFEKRIEKALSECEGVGRCEVILSIDSGPESVYAKEARESYREQESLTESDSDTKPSIMSEGSGREVPVLIKELYPEFRGAVIICDGADSANLRTRVTEAVAALTRLGTDRISVIKMKN